MGESHIGQDSRSPAVAIGIMCQKREGKSHDKDKLFYYEHVFSSNTEGQEQFDCPVCKQTVTVQRRNRVRGKLHGTKVPIGHRLFFAAWVLSGIFVTPIAICGLSFGLGDILLPRTSGFQQPIDQQIESIGSFIFGASLLVSAVIYIWMFYQISRYVRKHDFNGQVIQGQMRDLAYVVDEPQDAARVHRTVYREQQSDPKNLQPFAFGVQVAPVVTKSAQITCFTGQIIKEEFSLIGSGAQGAFRANKLVFETGGPIINRVEMRHCPICGQELAICIKGDKIWLQDLELVRVGGEMGTYRALSHSIGGLHPM